MGTNNQIVVYQTADNQTQINVTLENYDDVVSKLKKKVDQLSVYEEELTQAIAKTINELNSIDDMLNAQRFEETFYQKKNPSEVNGATVEPKKEPQGITEEAMLNYMVQNPDFLQKFKVLLGVGN